MQNLGPWVSSQGSAQVQLHSGTTGVSLLIYTSPLSTSSGFSPVFHSSLQSPQGLLPSSYRENRTACVLPTILYKTPFLDGCMVAPQVALMEASEKPKNRGGGATDRGSDYSWVPWAYVSLWWSAVSDKKGEKSALFHVNSILSFLEEQAL